MFRSYTKPWFTTALIKSVQRKTILYRKGFVVTKNDLRNIKKYKNMLISLLHLSEMNYYNGHLLTLEETFKNMETFQICAAKVIRSGSITKLIVDGNIVTDEKLIANQFNQ